MKTWSSLEVCCYFEASVVLFSQWIKEEEGSSAHPVAADDAFNCDIRCICIRKLLQKNRFLSPVAVSIFKEVSKQLWKFFIFSSWAQVKLDKILNFRRYNQRMSYHSLSLLCPEGLLHFISVTMFIQQRRNPFFNNYPKQDLTMVSPRSPCSLNSKLLCSEVSIKLSWRP